MDAGALVFVESPYNYEEAKSIPCKPQKQKDLSPNLKGKANHNVGTLYKNDRENSTAGHCAGGSDAPHYYK